MHYGPERDHAESTSNPTSMPQEPRHSASSLDASGLLLSHGHTASLHLIPEARPLKNSDWVDTVLSVRLTSGGHLINWLKAFIGFKKKNLGSGSRQVVGAELKEAVPALQELIAWQGDNYRTGGKCSNKWKYRGREITERTLTPTLCLSHFMLPNTPRHLPLPFHT